MEQIKVIAQIRNNLTGEIREYETEEFIENGINNPCYFNWREGNYSCDCNRHLFFKRANNEEDEDIECSDGKYSVNLKNKLNKEIYYREFN